ncbi:MAG: hypothetical protein NTX32_02405 [Candidatus Firestonebacteria bacterium]|nr:hypothetical protein [Candidatus Firestonebacteria bacterium]
MNSNIPDIKTVTANLQIMSAIELDLSVLYKAFALLFPPERKFWTSIAGDEIIHADNIKRMIALLLGKKLLYKIGNPLNRKALLLLRDNVQLYISDAKEIPLNENEVFSIARGLEESIIETRYLEYITTEDEEYNDFLKLILKETAEHKKLLETKILSRSAGNK